MPVPWLHIVKLAPQIISLSRELLGRTRAKPAPAELTHAADPGDLAQRLAALEENERRQAELVESMAVQQAELSRAVTLLHQRQRWLAAGIVVLAIALLWQIFRH